MRSIKIIITLSVACALLLTAVPAAMASSAGGLTGTFSGSNANYSMTITLNSDGTYLTTILQGGQTYRYSGYWSSDLSYLYFWPSGGTQSALSYWLVGDILTLTDWNTGDTMTMTRMKAASSFGPDRPQIPEGLIGTWTGKDGDSLLFITLDADGSITVAYDTPDAKEQAGDFSVSGNEFYAALPDGTTISRKFLLTGNTLIFAGDEEGETITLTRYYMALPTPSSAPTFPPQTAALPEPNILPENTPAQETAAPICTEAPPASVTSEPPVPVKTQGLCGIWLGKDDKGNKVLTLLPDGKIDMAYEQNAAPKQTGTYTADSSTITAEFSDGSKAVFRYILLGDTLLITDAQLGSPVTFLRQLPQPADASTDPALVGTWGGFEKGTYGEITMTGAGEVTFFIPSDPEYPVTYHCMASQGRISFQANGKNVECAYQVQDDVLQITGKDVTVKYSRKSGPLARIDQPAMAVSSAMDSAVVGTWGGLDGNIYTEITFYGDGSYVKFVPEDESLSVKGTCMSGSGNIVVLLQNGTLQGTYALSGNELAIAFTGAEPMKLLKQSGPLTRLAQTEE